MSFKTKNTCSSLLNTIAIYVIYIFLSNYKVWEAEAVEEIIGKSNYPYLKNPKNINYNSFKSISSNTPPIRNYCVIYHLHDMKGELKFDKGKQEEVIEVKEHFDCPSDINECKKRIPATLLGCCSA